MVSYSCIIPIYNEERRISNVLLVVTKVKEISEIICVDDGSTDNSVSVIKKAFPAVKLIQHNVNQGKTAAVHTGVKLVKNNTVLLLDSDLINLNAQEISNAFASFERNQLDCLLLNTAPMSQTDELLRTVFRFLLLAAGNRIIHKKYLIDLLSSGTYKSYYLEIAQNKYLMNNDKKVAYFDVSAQDVSKIHKIGFVKGWKDELKMWHQIITYAGFIFFIKQSLFFARKEVS
jgi:glycosyltransferase involved in cell wall biosynthesis